MRWLLLFHTMQCSTFLVFRCQESGTTLSCEEHQQVLIVNDTSNGVSLTPNSNSLSINDKNTALKIKSCIKNGRDEGVSYRFQSFP